MTDERLPSRLPIDARPRHGESIDSYIDRLARVNHLKPTALRTYVRTPPRRIGRFSWERLEAVAGRDASLLRRILGRGRCIGCDGYLVASRVTTPLAGRSARWCSHQCRQATRPRRDPRPAPDPWPPITSTCEQCGKYIGSDNRLRWCSSICQNAFLKRFRQRACWTCGTPLPIAKGRSPKWCSERCRWTANQQRLVTQRQKANTGDHPPSPLKLR